MEHHETRVIYIDRRRPRKKIPKVPIPEDAPTLVEVLSHALQIPVSDINKRIRRLIHEQCILPNTPTLKKALLASYGFMQENKEYNLSQLKELYPDAIVLASQQKFLWPRVKKSLIVSMRPDANGEAICFPLGVPDDMLCTEIYVSIDKEHAEACKIIHHYKHPRHSENPYFNYINRNPKNYSTGDCVIRALAGVFECSWHEVVDMLIDKATDLSWGHYAAMYFNQPYVFETILYKKGFHMHYAITKGGKPINGIEFCKQIGKQYRHGEPVFVYVGKHHVTAVIPTKNADGVYEYRIQDIYDCSTGDFLDYYVKEGISGELLEMGQAIADEYEGSFIGCHLTFSDKYKVVSEERRQGDLFLGIENDKGVISYTSAAWLLAMGHLKNGV